MSRYIILTEARRDLHAIRLYTVKNWGKQQADSYTDELTAVFRLLASNPSAGRDRSEDIGEGYLSFAHKKHVIYYRKIQGTVAIAAILHHSRLPQEHILIMKRET